MLRDHHVWFFWSLAFLLPWLALYARFPAHRRTMLRASVFTASFGLTEPIFVPEYWLPPSLFDLAARTGFDIESVVFSFGIGGVAAVLYDVVTRQRSRPMHAAQRREVRHRLHGWAIAAPFVAFTLLYLTVPWNPIYPAFVAMIVGALAAIYCRPDLARRTWIGGLLFTGYYWIFIEGLGLLAPGYVERVWNLEALSGVLIRSAPLEELLFAFTFGMYWSGVYEHLTWRETIGSVSSPGEGPNPE